VEALYKNLLAVLLCAILFAIFAPFVFAEEVELTSTPIPVESSTLYEDVKDIKNITLSIYTFLAFAITVTAGGFVIYILLKPIFYFLR